MQAKKPLDEPEESAADFDDVGAKLIGLVGHLWLAACGFGLECCGGLDA